MKRLAVIMRHGAYEKQKYNDGPLTKNGEQGVWTSAEQIRAHITTNFPLSEQQPRVNIAFLVSGSLRGLDTYRITRNVLGQDNWLSTDQDIWIPDYVIYLTRQEIRTDFFSTPDEDAVWRTLRADKTFDAATKELGSDEALLRHQLPLIKGPADRVVSATRSGTERITIIITHSPHDRLIVEGLTGVRPTDALDLGCFRIVEFK